MQATPTAYGYSVRRGRVDNLPLFVISMSSKRTRRAVANTTPDIFEAVQGSKKADPPKPPQPEPETPKRRRKSTEVMDDEKPNGFVIGEYDYIHAFVCAGTKHPYVVATATMHSPVNCPTCGKVMHRHFFSKRRK